MSVQVVITSYFILNICWHSRHNTASSLNYSINAHARCKLPYIYIRCQTKIVIWFHRLNKYTIVNMPKRIIFFKSQLSLRLDNSFIFYCSTWSKYTSPKRRSAVETCTIRLSCDICVFSKYLSMSFYVVHHFHILFIVINIYNYYYYL